MKIKYYEIDEKLAKIAHEMNYYYEFKPLTPDYKKSVDRVYALAEKKIKQYPTKEDTLLKYADKYARCLAKYLNESSRIDAMCPSILVAGPANFPVRKKEKQNSLRDKNHKYFEYIDSIKAKIKYYDGAILSTEENAIEQLEEKLEKLKTYHEQKKILNKLIRMDDSDKKELYLKALLKDEELIEKFKNLKYKFDTTNTNNEIKRIEKRIENLKQIKQSGNKEIKKDNYIVKYNTNDMKIQFLFDNKPDEKTRNILKSHSFRYSPKNKIWQRMLTKNGKYATKQVIEELEKK